MLKGEIMQLSSSVYFTDGLFPKNTTFSENGKEKITVFFNNSEIFNSTLLWFSIIFVLSSNPYNKVTLKF